MTRDEMERGQAEILVLSRMIDRLPPGPCRDRLLWDRGLIQRAIALSLEGPAREIAEHEIDRSPGQVH